MPGSSLSVLTSPTIGGSSSSYRRSAAAASPSARPSRLAVDARSRSTPRPRTRCASIATAQLLGRDFAGDAYADRDLVFADELGKPVHPQRLTEWFRRHRKAAGVPAGTLHILRHTAATLALTSGVPVHIVAARLGGTPATVLGTYGHLLPQSDEIAAERVAALLAR